MNRIVVLVLLLPVWAWGQTPSDTTAAPLADGAESISLGWLVFRTIVTLLIILGLIFFLVFVVRKYFGKQLPGLSHQGWLRVLARAPVGPRQSLTLVQVFDKVLLLGITENSINTLLEMEKDANIQRVIEELNQRPGKMSGAFSGLLRSKLES